MALIATICAIMKLKVSNITEVRLVCATVGVAKGEGVYSPLSKFWHI